MNESSHREHRGDTEATELNRVTDQVIGAAIEVHKVLGPGLLESAYQRALAHELALRGVEFEQQKLCPITYKDLVNDDAYRLDFLVGGVVVVELKTVDALEDVRTAQVLTCLRFSSRHLGPPDGLSLNPSHPRSASDRSVISVPPL